mmetsp:Transcript_69199/g.200430  ORF Transcript_69199/g.200430 Transcript_69199/m.200430 type:complete len:251 (+) Transcript_69199:428-1180(+)
MLQKPSRVVQDAVPGAVRALQPHAREVRGVDLLEVAAEDVLQQIAHVPVEPRDSSQDAVELRVPAPGVNQVPEAFRLVGAVKAGPRRRLAEQQLVQQDAPRKPIMLVAVILGRQVELQGRDARREVAGFADDAVREAGGIEGRERTHLRQAIVHERPVRRAPISRHDIVRLDVPVDNPVPVQVPHAQCHLGHDVLRVVGAPTTADQRKLCQSRSVVPGHNQRGPRRVRQAEGLEHARVAEQRCRLHPRTD